jgi:molybdenum cofactor cytidylyltransferase
MGQPKQLLPFGHKTLLNHVVSNVKAVFGDRTYVALGAHYDQILKSLELAPDQCILCENWEKGIGLTIATGLKKLLSIKPTIEEVMFILGDQPFFTPNKLQQYLTPHFNRFDAVGFSYPSKIGVPALFRSTTFQKLKSLSGRKGASVILNSNEYKVGTIKGRPDWVVDIDTFEDWKKYSNGQ